MPYILGWLLGVPLIVLVILYLIFLCRDALRSTVPTGARAAISRARHGFPPLRSANATAETC